MEVRSRKEAWSEADRLFPTDYEKNDRDSMAAGYDIYTSTSNENRSWISDLGNRLELNIWGKNGIETTNIWIVEEPEIVEINKWYMSDVRNCCVKNNFYTCGTIAAYSKLLEFVEENEPTLQNIYKAAKDIMEHSEGQTIENIMFCLNADAVFTYYQIKEA